MTGKFAVLTPTVGEQAVELGRSTWRKQILPIGELPYRGRNLKFTRQYLDGIVSAFREGAYDTVPFQLAGDDNAHTNAVDRSAGEIVGLEATDEGLYATVSVTDKGAEILRDNPKLPVSVRVVEEYERNDGKSSKRYGAALQHVLGTWAPRVAGMSPWAPIECSEDADEVIDLSEPDLEVIRISQNTDLRYDLLTDGRYGPISQQLRVVSVTHASAQSGEETPKELVDMPPLSAEQQETLKALFKQWQEEAEPTPEKAEAPAQPAEFKEAPVEEVKAEKPAEEPTEEPAEEVAEVPEPIAASTPEADQKSVDLAQVELATKLDKAAIELAELRAERDEEKWRYESEQLVRDYGIPPAIVNLAEPLLRGSKHVVELSDGNTVDAGEVIRSVLSTVAKTYGKAVDLSDPIGSAHEGSGSSDAREAQERDAFLASQRNFVK